MDLDNLEVMEDKEKMEKMEKMELLLIHQNLEANNIQLHGVILVKRVEMVVKQENLV